MIDLDKEVFKLKNMNSIYFNIENLYYPADPERYNKYLTKYIFKYYSDLNLLNKCCIEKNLNNNNFFAGIYYAEECAKQEPSCIIPKRKTLYDEMVCIHELTHLVSKLNYNMDVYSKYKEIIPFFNEYDYLKSIHEFYAEQYEIFRLNQAIKAAKNLDNENKELVNPYIIAYLILKNRMNNYNINTLNKINSSKWDLEKKLIKKGYTI